MASSAPAPKNVLVTGGEGFLGEKLVASLRERGHTVATYDFVSGKDICNKDQFRASLAECGAKEVIHLAAQADLYKMKAHPEISEKVNIEGTRNVLSVCDELGARCLFASTCCAYGNNECHPSNEESPLCPTEIYAKSKKKGEAIVNEFGKPHCSLRLATFYGPTMRAALVHAVFLDRVHRGQELLVHGTGKQTRTYTHVDDVVSGIVAVLECDKYAPAVNISHDESWSVYDVAKFAMEAVGHEVPMRNVEEREGQIFTEEIDNSLLRSMGWKARWSLKEGMADSYRGMLEGPLKGVPLVKGNAASE